METKRPTPENITNFPSDNPRAKIVLERGRYYVCERKHYWHPKKKRSVEERLYLGRIVGDTYYTIEEYKKKYKRDGSLRAVERPAVRKYNKKKIENIVGTKEEKGSNVLDEENKTEAPVEEQQDPNVSISELSTKRVGATVLFDRISKDIGIYEDLVNTWGENAANIILSLSFHWLSTGNNACYLFKEWSSYHLLPFSQSLTSKEISEFMESIATTSGWEKSFFGARVKRLGDDEVFSYDATNIATKACDILDAQFGKSKEGGYRRQIGMAVLFGHKSGLPALFRLFPGNISDVTTVADLLNRIDLITENKIIAAVLDRGYFSLNNIARFIDSNQKVLLAAKMDVSWVRQAAEDVMPDLWRSSCRLTGHDVWGKTIEMHPGFADGIDRTVYVHVFRDESKSAVANHQFFDEIESFENKWKIASYASDQEKKALLNSATLQLFKSPKSEPGKCPLIRDHEAIDRATRYLGFFASVSTMPCDAQKAIETYSNRDAIEKCFKAGKSDIGMGVIRSHSDETMRGRFIVSFVALSILCELHKRMNSPRYKFNSKLDVSKIIPPLSTEYSFNKILETLAPIQVIYGREGIKPQYLEITGRQKEIADRLNCSGIYDVVPDY